MPSLTACLRAAAAAVTVAAAAPAVADEATWDVSIAGITIGQVTLTTQESGGAYTAASRIETAGLAGLLANFYFRGQSTGRVTSDGSVIPSRFVGDSRSPRADRRTEIEWADGTPVSVSVEPPRSRQPDPATQAGTIDPVSAGFVVMRDLPASEVCSVKVDVFDGSRRSRLNVGKPTTEAGAIHCDGTYSRVEGEGHTFSSQREFPFRLVFARDGEMAKLRRVETRTKFGTAVLERRT